MFSSMMFYSEEIANLQLDRVSYKNLKTDEEFEKHTLGGASVEKTIDREVLILTKGEEIQKLSVIETLPQLLTEDAHACITRVLPKIQQLLPTASTEFHLAASVIFKQILEQKIVSPSTFSNVFLSSIFTSLENREPVISHAWLETILDLIELLPIDVIRREILPVAINLGQLSQPVTSRMICCRLMGKIGSRFDSISVKRDLLPTVQNLCQDVSSDVRACIGLQLQFLAEHMTEDVVLSFLPFFIELLSDEESGVRQAAVQATAYLLPKLPAEKIQNVMIPLIKDIFTNAVKSDDNVLCVIAQEYGRIARNLEAYLTPQERTWFVKYYQQLAQLGVSSVNTSQDSKHDFTFITSFAQLNSHHINEKSIECRQSCAYNMPAMFIFASQAPEGMFSLVPTFRSLANDSFFMVRRTIACSLHEVIKILGTRSGIVKTELLRLWKDDHEEVLQGLVPHTSVILDHLLQNKLIGEDQAETLTIDLGKALIKCEAEISSTTNWRLSAMMINQLEILTKCFPSDFIYMYLVPVMMDRILFSRPLPVRLAAGRTLLIYLRYNLKFHHKSEIRHKICVELAHNSSCYVRMIFIQMMREAMSVFSSFYFKEHFCFSLLSLMEDPVPNVRLKVVTLLPSIKSILKLPSDKKLLAALETNLRNLINNEKDVDVAHVVKSSVRDMEKIDVPTEPHVTKSSDVEDTKRYEEEKKLEAMSSGKTTMNLGSPGKKPPALVPHKPLPTGGQKSDAFSRTTRGRPTSLVDTSKTSQSSSRSAVSRSHVTRTFPDHSKPSTSSDDIAVLHWSRYAKSLERPALYGHNTSTHTLIPSFSSPSLQELLTKRVSTSSITGQCGCYTSRSHSAANSAGYRSSADGHICSCLSDSGFLKQPTSNPSIFHPKQQPQPHDYSKQSPSLTSVKTGLYSDNSYPNYKVLNIPRRPYVQSHYGTCWGGYGSMPEIPVKLTEDEFMIDAGIRIPQTLISSQSNLARVTNLQEILHRNRRFSNMDRMRRCEVHYDHLSKPPIYRTGLDDKSPTSSQQPQIQPINHDRLKPMGDKKPHLDKDSGQRFKQTTLQTKGSVIDRSKRHAGNFSGKILDSKDPKSYKFKRHSAEVTDYNSVDRNGRSLRRFSTLDVNHNQGISRIPVRSVHVSGSRTAPATRNSSPIRIKTDHLNLDKIAFNALSSSSSAAAAAAAAVDSYARERHLRRFLSSDEEVEKLFQKL